MPHHLNHVIVFRFLGSKCLQPFRSLKCYGRFGYILPYLLSVGTVYESRTICLTRLQYLQFLSGYGNHSVLSCSVSANQTLPLGDAVLLAIDFALYMHCDYSQHPPISQLTRGFLVYEEGSYSLDLGLRRNTKSVLYRTLHRYCPPFSVRFEEVEL